MNVCFRLIKAYQYPLIAFGGLLLANLPIVLVANVIPVNVLQTIDFRTLTNGVMVITGLGLLIAITGIWLMIWSKRLGPPGFGR
jgi:hypothetical protein